MGRVASALDNAVAESFNSTLEWELLSRRDLATFAQARREVARFIEAYNHTRRHSSCEMKPPVVYEQLLADRTRHSDTDHKRGGMRSRSDRFSGQEPVFAWTQTRPNRITRPTMRNFNHQ